MRTALVFGLAALAAAPIHPQGPAAERPNIAKPATLTETAPDTFNAFFETSVGSFVVRVHREWAPHGADRFYNLVKYGFYDGCRFFRVIPKFAAQFGINGNPEVSEAWLDARLPEDRARQSNTRGRVTFAQGTLANTRTTQVFINYGNNSRLDIDSFAPFGEVISSMVLVELIFSGYGEGPDQNQIQFEGNAFLTKYFPKMSYIRKATIEKK